MKNKDTETKILDAARNIFIKKGREGAKMQEIADEAGVNKALLHYYFRNKENIYERICEDILGELVASIIFEMNEDINFKEELKVFIDRHFKFLENYQDIIPFAFWEMRKDDNKIINILIKKFNEKGKTPFSYISEKIERGKKNGELKDDLNFINFYLNLMGLTIFFFITKPLISSILDLDEQDYKKLLQIRKKEVFRILWNDIKK